MTRVSFKLGNWRIGSYFPISGCAWYHRLQIPEKKTICLCSFVFIQLFKLQCQWFLFPQWLWTFSCQRYEKIQSPRVRIFLHLLGVNYITCPTAYSSNLVIISQCFQVSLYLSTINNLVSTLNFFLIWSPSFHFHMSYNYLEKNLTREIS